MLNKLGRKRMTITVGKRKPTLADQVDATIDIALTNPPTGEYIEVVLGKHRTQGNAGQFQYTRGQTPALIPMDGTPFMEYSHPEPAKVENTSTDWSDLD